MWMRTTGNYSTSKYYGGLFSTKAPCKMWCYNNVRMRQACKFELLLQDLTGDPAHSNMCPEIANLLSPTEANFHLLFFLISRWNSIPCFTSTQVLILSPATMWDLSFPPMRWFLENILLTALGLIFYSFSTSHLQFIQPFLMADLNFCTSPVMPLSTRSFLCILKYELVYRQQKMIALNLSSVFLLYQSRLSVVFLGALSQDLFSEQTSVPPEPSQLEHG